MDSMRTTNRTDSRGAANNREVITAPVSPCVSTETDPLYHGCGFDVIDDGTVIPAGLLAIYMRFDSEIANHHAYLLLTAGLSAQARARIIDEAKSVHTSGKLAHIWRPLA